MPAPYKFVFVDKGIPVMPAVELAKFVNGSGACILDWILLSCYYLSAGMVGLIYHWLSL
jgi:hypothetical protein